MTYHLNPNVYSDDIKKEPTRLGFGRGLKVAGELDQNVVALSPDLTGSVKVDIFQEAFPERFIQVGIAEQNIVTVASGLARAGKIPFAAAYAAFSPGRNWEQIKTTICLNDQPVKIVGSHAGVTVGPDGATHQMLEDIALMRVLPNMVVIAPGDSIEAEKATIAMAKDGRPTYMRVCRDKSGIFSTMSSPFEIGKAYVLRQGHDVSLIGTGILTHELLMASKILEENGISAEVVHVPTIKPLDEVTVLESVKKTGRVVTAEEAQIAGGLGGAVAELLSDKLPTPVLRIGVQDRYGESGEPRQLIEYFELDYKSIVKKVTNFVNNTPKYHQNF